VTVTVGAGVAGGGDEFWTHPAIRMQSRNMRKTRRRDAIFMARDLYHYLFTSLSHFFKKLKKWKRHSSGSAGAFFCRFIDCPVMLWIYKVIPRIVFPPAPSPDLKSMS
jgi:hypothetical protein